MYCVGESSLLFLGVKENISKKTGEKYQLIKLADPKEFEKFEFFRRDELFIDKEINVGDEIIPTFEISKNGFNTNVNLISMNKI